MCNIFTMVFSVSECLLCKWIFPNLRKTKGILQKAIFLWLQYPLYPLYPLCSKDLKTEQRTPKNFIKIFNLSLLFSKRLGKGKTSNIKLQLWIAVELFWRVEGKLLLDLIYEVRPATLLCRVSPEWLRILQTGYKM